MCTRNENSAGRELAVQHDMSQGRIGLLLALMTALAFALPADEDLDELFAVRLIVPADTAGRELRARVQVYKPYGFEPIPGAPVSAALDLGDEVLSLAGVTDEHGEVEMTVALSQETLPRGHSSSVELTATASYRGIAREVSRYLNFEGEPRIVISTDKKMYQPGQTLHVRTLWLDENHVPMADEEVELTISEPSYRDVAAAELMTSPFGITSFDWQIPATAEPGDYEIYAESGPAEGLARVRIMPYSPPSFQVIASPAEPFYLSGDEAAVEVEVKTFDGAGLADVEVDLDADDFIRSTGPVRTGEDGRAVLRLDLADAFEELEPRYYLGYVDLDFGVSATDPVSGARRWHGRSPSPAGACLAD